MPKTITISQDKLLVLKETAVDGVKATNTNRYGSNIMEVAPEVDKYKISGEDENGDVIGGGNYFHINEGVMNRIPKQVIPILLKYKPNEFSRWAVITTANLNLMPKYFEKKSYAIEYKKWLSRDWRMNPVIIVDLNSINFTNESYGVTNKLSNIDLSCVGKVECESTPRKSIVENFDFEVDSSEINLSSFKKKHELAPNIWNPDGKLNSRVRLKLLDIADDFWEFVNLKWVKPNGIILTGSICNFNWSQYSDIDLHLIVDFDEIDEKAEFVKDYLDSKKNEWNNEHSGLEIMGYKVELYVQNTDEIPQSSGIYDLEENDWVREPSKDDIKPIALNKFSIKDKAAKIMTIIDDMYDSLASTDDSYKIEQMGDDADYLWKKVKKMRQDSLDKDGESGSGNIVYKILRRSGYLDRLYKLSNAVYDKTNSIRESKEVIKEYLDKDYGMPLYNYFKWAKTAKDEEKVADIVYQCPDVVEKYLEEIEGKYNDLDELCEEIYADEDLVYDEEFVERFAKAVCNNKLYDKFIDSVYNLTYSEYLPTWMTMDLIRPIKNEWCIHFTSDAYNIAREGFTGGTPEIDSLAYTNAGQQKNYAGYDFAFLIDDNDVDFNNYGDEAVIFRASGVLARHYGDRQRQVIFWGPSVKDIIVIKKENYSSDWAIEGTNGQIFKTGKPSELAFWATENLPQYRRQIIAGKNGYQPWGFKRPSYYNESIKKYITLLKDYVINEESVADGSSEGNPYNKRWKAEREALKSYICNYGCVMQSKEDNKNGKLYKCLWDKGISQLIGYNYCLCVQWDEINLKPKSVVYIRALDKFTPNIRRNIQYDTRGVDNQMGTYDDLRYESAVSSKPLITESKNSKRAHMQTRKAISEYWGISIDDPKVEENERYFEKSCFGEGKRVDWFIVLEPNAYHWYMKCLSLETVNEYLDWIFRKATTFENPSEYVKNFREIEDFDKLEEYITKLMDVDNKAEMEQINGMEANLNSNYKVLGPLDFAEAAKYGDYSGYHSGEDGRICYTQAGITWNHYSHNGEYDCYLLLRNDWEDLDGEEHDGSEKNNNLGELSRYDAYDDYGLSMIFVFISPEGELKTCNTRWNHEARYSPGRSVDMALNQVDISKLMGAPFGQIFDIE